jgi:hypothetical protein
MLEIRAGDFRIWSSPKVNNGKRNACVAEWAFITITFFAPLVAVADIGATLDGVGACCTFLMQQKIEVGGGAYRTESR